MRRWRLAHQRRTSLRSHHRIKLAVNVTITIYFVLALLFGALLPWFAWWLAS
jgi:hypothetical protein